MEWKEKGLRTARKLSSPLILIDGWFDCQQQVVTSPLHLIGHEGRLRPTDETSVSVGEPSEERCVTRSEGDAADGAMMEERGVFSQTARSLTIKTLKLSRIRRIWGRCTAGPKRSVTVLFCCANRHLRAGQTDNFVNATDI